MTGRFIQADTIVPGGVQGLDRYAYVNNSPAMYIDPSGHTTLCGATCEAAFEQSQYSLDDVALMYGVPFSPGWNVKDKAAALLGVLTFAKALQEEINSARDAAYQSCLYYAVDDASSCSSPSYITASQAFVQTFGTDTNPITLEWVNDTCAINGSTCYADAYKPNTIRVWSSYFTAAGTTARTPVTPQLIVHELGHVFNVRAGRGPESYVANYDGGALLIRPDGFQAGFAFGQDDSGSEIFADMVVGWAFGQWADDNLGPVREEVMTTNMSEWILDARFHR